jgi:deazaflavin-dependent oxidoreductase (nitroreductase family)
MTPDTSREPLAARLHGLVRFSRPLELAIIRNLRRYLERAPGYVLLTTRGRRTGLAREVLLPCARIGDDVVVISTYGRRSNWVRNLCADPEVTLTCNGQVVRGRAEVVDDIERKWELVAGDPLFLVLPIGVLFGLTWTILRALSAPIIRRWVAARPVVLIRRQPTQL